MDTDTSIFGEESETTNPTEGVTPPIIKEGELKDELTPENLNGEGNEVEGKATPTTVYYTPEEMRSLSPDGVDTSKIPPEMIPFYKSMLAPVTRKSQELANKLREADEANLERPQAKTPDLFEAYMQDPRGVVQAINTKILELEDVDPLDENFKPARKEIRRLEALKEDLKEKKDETTSVQGKQIIMLSELNTTITTEFKDWTDRKTKLETYAMGTLGYAKEELAYMTNPFAVGKSAVVKFIKTVNRLYEADNAGKTAEGKVKKTTPTELERAGSGGGGKKEKTIEERFYG